MAFCFSGREATAFRMSSRVSFTVQADAGSTPSGATKLGPLQPSFSSPRPSSPHRPNFLLSRLKFLQRLTAIR